MVTKGENLCDANESLKKEGNYVVKPTRFKAWLVVKGLSHKERIDYHEVFSLVLKHKIVHVLLAMVSALDLEFEELISKQHFFMVV